MFLSARKTHTKELIRMEILIVDRIENGIVVLEKEDLSHIEISISELDFEIKEGSVLGFYGGRYTKELDEEAKRRQRILLLQRKVYKKAKK